MLINVDNNYHEVPYYGLSAKILSGATLSNLPLNIGKAALCGLFIPSGFTGTTIYLQSSSTFGGTYARVQVDGADYAITVTAGKNVAVSNLAVTLPWNFIKIEAATAQAADCTIPLVLA